MRVESIDLVDHAHIFVHHYGTIQCNLRCSKVLCWFTRPSNDSCLAFADTLRDERSHVTNTAILYTCTIAYAVCCFFVVLYVRQIFARGIYMM